MQANVGSVAKTLGKIPKQKTSETKAWFEAEYCAVLKETPSTK